MKEDLLILKKYYKQAAARIAPDSFFYETLNHKFRHSVAVWQAGRQIMAQTPELSDVSPQFQLLAEQALLFHDVGRFQEAVCRYQAELQNTPMDLLSNQCDHGQIGYDLLKNMPPYNDLRILLAIKCHGKMMEEVRTSDLWQQAEQSPLGKDAEKILYLVRDADKMANLRVIKQNNHLKEDLFFKQLTPQMLNAPISEAVWQQFLQHQTVLFANVRSYADRLLMVLSWIFDLNYYYSKKLFVSEGYARYLLTELSKYHTNTADLDQIPLIVSSVFTK